MEVINRRFLFFVVVACAQALGQAAPVAQSVNFGTRIKQTVAIVQLTCRNGNKTEEIAGTGFFVLYPDDRLGPSGSFIYLITNRHVAFCWDEQRNPLRVESVGVRINLVDGTSKVLENEAHGNFPWVLPTDDSVDLAVLPIAIDQKMFQYLPIGLTEFATDEVLTKEKVSEGDRIIFTGFFQQYPGVRRIQPIVREGIVAMMPDENFPTTTGKLGKVFLGDMHIFLGNSGSPVFIDLGGVRNGSIRMGEDYKLFGVVSGYFYEKEDLSLQVATAIHAQGNANSGIAMIVPASAVKDLLDSPKP